MIDMACEMTPRSDVLKAKDMREVSRWLILRKTAFPW